MPLKASKICSDAAHTLSVISRGMWNFRSIFGPCARRTVYTGCLSHSTVLRTERSSNIPALIHSATYPHTHAHRLHVTNSRWSSSRANMFHKIPINAWDSHMHVVEPSAYPVAPNAQYMPSPHTISQALQFYSSIGINNMVLVQPSIYGNDNSCMLSALRELGPSRSRAVVTFDPDVIKLSTLREWHSIGVRGVRVNLVSVGKKLNAAKLAATLKQYADIIRPLDWVLQLYVPLRMTVDLLNIVPTLGVKVCLDHFGQPTFLGLSAVKELSRSLDPYILPGFGSMIELLKQGKTYVKFSAPYRISSHETYFDLEPMARELLRVAGKTRIVFATDWPHTRFEGLDIKPFIQKTLNWCGEDHELVEKLFRENAEELWGIER